jgi:hypothetical protein
MCDWSCDKNTWDYFNKCEIYQESFSSESDLDNWGDNDCETFSDTESTNLSAPDTESDSTDTSCHQDGTD